MKKSLGYAQTNQGRFVQELQEYLRIPSISTLPQHQPDIQTAADWAAAHLEQIGLSGCRVLPIEAGSPFVYGEWLQQPGAQTILIYGHYDVQPVDPAEAWDSPPFSAEIIDNTIWARGASDNKGQHFAHLKAIESILATAGTLPVNIKVLLEGEEETGSPNIDAFVQANQRLLQADFGLISDGAMFAPGRPELNYGLRGVAALELHVHGPGRDLHSGSYGGTVLNPIQALSGMLASLHDPDGRVTVPGFYEQVRSLSPEERKLLEANHYDQAHWQADTGAPAPWGETDFSLLERIGARPTLEINGIWGGFQGAGVKTVIPASAGAKITLRLVPYQEPEVLLRLVIAHLQRTAPPQVTVEVYNHGGSWPALMPVDSPEMSAAAEVLETVWGTEPIFNLGGGSLPVVSAFQRILDLPFVLMPLGLDDNRHSPNEHLRLEYFFNGIETAIRYYHALAG